MTITQLATSAELEFDFADRLRKAMRHADMGISELAEELDVSRNSISSWLKGKHMPRPRDIRAAAAATGVPVEWLITGKAPTENDGGQQARPEGFEPPTFWSVVFEGLFADQLDSITTFWSVIIEGYFSHEIAGVGA